MTDDYSKRLVLSARLNFLQERELEIWEELRRIVRQKQDIQCELSGLLGSIELDQEDNSMNGTRRLALQPPQAQEVSTMDATPAELLVHIFGLAVHAYTPDTTARIYPPHPAVTISHVCRRWRALALSTSSLWSTIVFGRRLQGVSTSLQRSGFQPLSIYHAYPYAVVAPKIQAMKEHLFNTSKRWKSVKWSSSEGVMKDILLELNTHNGTYFDRLSLLDLSIIHRDRNSLVRRVPASFPSLPDIQFPSLSDIRLSYVLPSELPPSTNVTLRTFHLHYPMKSHAQWPYLAKMSEVCAFLYRAPNLEELVFDDTVPLMDIRLLDNVRDAPSPVDRDSRQTRPFIPPIEMKKVTRFQWSFAPPKDAWRLFYIVQMPSLKRLDIVLNSSQIRWTQFYGGMFSLMDTAQLISNDVTNPVVRFDALEELTLETLDAESLYQVFRKMDFPVLKRLTLSFIHADIQTPKLPRLESIFREPRMPTLHSLAIRNFKLDQDETRTALQYMPCLEHLTLDSCSGVDIMQLLGNGGPQPTASAPRKWVCPQLEHLTLVDCMKIRFNALAEVIKLRKTCSGRPSGYPSESQEGRVVKPLRRRIFHQIQNRELDGTAGCRQSPSQAFPSPFSSPSRPTAQDWSARDRSLLHAIKVVDVVGCKRISEAELLSLRDEVYGVEEVYWSAG